MIAVEKNDWERIDPWWNIHAEGKQEELQWINVNAKLLREGYARVYTLPPNIKYSDYFLKLEREARENCRGLW